jgi:PhnB protein
MRSASPFVVVDNCKEAVEYYQGVFGGEIKVLFSQGEQWMHAELHVGGGKIHFADTMGNAGAKSPGENVKIILDMDSEEEMRKVFEALSKDGKVMIELQDTFFGALHGQVTDKHQVGWVMNYFRS